MHPLEPTRRISKWPGAQGLTTQKVSAQTVGNRQRIAVAGVPGSELPLEVCRPQVVGMQRLVDAASGMLHPAPEGSAPDQTMPLENLSSRTRGRPRLVRATILQPPHLLLRTPPWLEPPG